MSESAWHVAVGQRQEGPHDTAVLVEGFRAGRWPRSALVWREGMSSWAPVSDVPELRAAVSEGPAVPPVPRARGRSHEIDFRVLGEEMQFVEIELDPGETVIAEAGGMMYMDASIEMQTRLGDGSEPESGGLLGKALSAGKRLVTGESLFMTHFTSRGAGKAHVAFAAPYPGRIVPLDLAELGGEMLCQKDAFLCAAHGTAVGIAFTKRFGAGLFGGEGFILQRLTGDGLAFVHAGGTIVERDLGPGETLKLDTGCLVALQPSVSYDIEMVKGVKSLVFGGEGLFFATLRGPGRVWLQSLPFSRLAGRLAAAAGPRGGKGEGNVLGGFGLGGLLGGDE